MTPDQINLIQDSFSRAGRVNDATAEVFYTRLFKTAQSRAIRHVDDSVQAKDYAPVGEAFTIEMKESWIAAYDTLSSVMLNAAYPEAVA